MGLLRTIKNDVKAAVGYQQSFTELLEAGDTTRALAMMQDNNASVNYLRDYNIATHKVMERTDKAIYDKKGNFLRWQKRWKIPIPYPVFINEIALVFLYGKPVIWGHTSDESTDDVFDNYVKLNEKIRFNAHVRKAKRIAGAEGKSAIFYHVYRDGDEPKLELNTLSKSNGDDIYVMKDQYQKVNACGWGYTLTEAGNKTTYHVDIYTKELEYHCKRTNFGWEVDVRDNPIHKIPFLLFEQEPESVNVQPMIHRVETMESTDADVNDRFSNPAMVASSEVINSLPKAEEEAKLFILKNGGELKYLTWDQASQSKENEYKRLDGHILSKSFTPNIDFDNMKNLGNLSAKAIRKVMFLAVIKAEKHKENHDGYMSRHSSLMKAIMGNVLDYKNKSKYDRLEITHEFQEPFGEDQSDILDDMLKQFGAGAMSLETVVESSYLVKNPKKELERIKANQQEALEREKELNRMDVFGEGE